MAVVANTGSNNISLIDLTASTPAVQATICTAAVGAVPTGAPPACPSSGPTSVSVDYVRNIALVVNSTSKTIAVVDLNTRAVTDVISVNPVPTAVADTPGAVGINPVTGRALIAMQKSGSGSGAGYGVLMDLTQNPPAIVGVVSISTGQKTRVAVEPHLNWAISDAWPAGLGGYRGLEPAVDQPDFLGFKDFQCGPSHGSNECFFGASHDTTDRCGSNPGGLGHRSMGLQTQPSTASSP